MSGLVRTSSDGPIQRYASQKLGYEVALPLRATRPISTKPRHRTHTIKYSKVKKLPAVREADDEGGRRRRRRRRTVRRTK